MAIYRQSRPLPTGRAARITSLFADHRGVGRSLTDQVKHPHVHSSVFVDGQSTAGRVRVAC